jgi:hypothetical protein
MNMKNFKKSSLTSFINPQNTSYSDPLEGVRGTGEKVIPDSKYFTRICLPDGSDYWLLNLVNSDNASGVFEQNKEQIFESEEEFRVLFPHSGEMAEGQRGWGDSEGVGNQKKTLPWETNFLFYTHKEILDFLKKTTIFEENEDLTKQIRLYEVKKGSKELEKKILKDLMIGSFGHRILKNDNGEKVLEPKSEKLKKIENKFEESLRQSHNRIFLIKIEEKVVGSFTLAINEEQKFIQLESVAGRGFEEKYKDFYWQSREGKNKINLVLVKLFEILKDEYQGFSLFFTCSKPPVVKMYESTGIKFNPKILGVKISTL